MSSQSTINIQIHHFKTTSMCPRSIAGVPSSQALPGFLVIGALAVWRQNIKHEKKSHWNKYTIGKKHVFEYCARWGYYPRLSGRRSDLMRGDKQTFSFQKKTAPGRMANTPRAGTGDSAWSWRHQCSTMLNHQGNLSIIGTFLIRARQGPGEWDSTNAALMPPRNMKILGQEIPRRPGRGATEFKFNSCHSTPTGCLGNAKGPLVEHPTF